MTEDSSEFPLASLPQWKEDQRGALESIEVGSIEDVLPPRFQEIYQENRGFVGEKTVPLEKGFLTRKRLELTGYENGVLSAKSLRGIRLPFFDESVSRIEDYYIIDSSNEKAWNAMELFKPLQFISDSEGSRTQGSLPKVELLKIPGLRPGLMVSNSRLIPEFNLFILNDFADSPVPKQLEGHFKGKGRMLDRITPFHEAGHALQPRGPHFDLEESVVAFLVDVGLLRETPQHSRSISSAIKEITSFKQNLITKERNANAFALGVIRQLREQGLDIFRGIPQSEVIATVDAALQTHDMWFVTVDRPSFSQRERAKLRRQTKNSATFVDPTGAPDSSPDSES